MTPAPCLLTAPTDDELEVADPGYLEDYAAATMTDELAAMQSIPQAEIYNGTVTFGGGGTYYYPYVTTTSNGRNYPTAGTYTVSYGGHTTAPIAYGDTVTITGYGGGGGGAFPLTNDWVYLGDTSATFHLYTPPNVFDESADQPWTLQQATQEWLQAEYRAWLAAERQWINGWLRAERDWAAAEHYRQRAAVKERAEALLISLLPEFEKQRYRHEGYFEVIGSHGGHYQDPPGHGGQHHLDAPRRSAGLRSVLSPRHLRRGGPAAHRRRDAGPAAGAAG